MLTSNVKLINFEKNKKKINIIKILKSIKKNFDNKKDLFLQSLSINYRNSFEENNLKKYKKFKLYRLIGMGGSSLGAKAIYSFLKNKIKKEFDFFDNIYPYKHKDKKKKRLNIIISKP